MTAALYEIPVIDAPSQRLETVLNQVAVSITLLWNEWAGRWSLTVEIDGEAVLSGRRLVVGSDLLAGYDLGLGRLFVVDWSDGGGEPDRDNLPSGDFRLLSLVEEDE